MKTGEDAMLPQMIRGTIFGKHHAAGRVANRMEIRPECRVHDKRREVDPLVLPGDASADIQASLFRFEFDSCFRGR